MSGCFKIVVDLKRLFCLFNAVKTVITYSNAQFCVDFCFLQMTLLVVNVSIGSRVPLHQYKIWLDLDCQSLLAHQALHRIPIYVVGGPPPPSVTSSSSSENQLQQPSPQFGFGFSNSTFTYEELALSTDGFSNTNLLGQGGFGYVHKGVIPNGKEVAIKQLKVGSGQGEREFQAEVEIISRVNHKHLVSLVGYCSSGAQRIPVYEFVPNNTMEFHLHGAP